jgi:hypothetical protein
MEGADPQRAAFLALWHDSQETRTTDIPHLAKRYVSTARNEVVTQEQVGPLPPAVAGMISAAVAEYGPRGGRCAAQRQPVQDMAPHAGMVSLGQAAAMSLSAG